MVLEFDKGIVWNSTVVSLKICFKLWLWKKSETEVMKHFLFWILISFVALLIVLSLALIFAAVFNDELISLNYSLLRWKSDFLKQLHSQKFYGVQSGRLGSQLVEPLLLIQSRGNVAIKRWMNWCVKCWYVWNHAGRSFTLVKRSLEVLVVHFLKVQVFIL